MNQHPEVRDELSKRPPPAGVQQQQQEVDDKKDPKETEAKTTSGVSSAKPDDVVKPNPKPDKVEPRSDGGGVVGDTGSNASGGVQPQKTPTSPLAAPAISKPTISPVVPVRHVLPQIPTMSHSRLAVSKASRKVQTKSTFSSCTGLPPYQPLYGVWGGVVKGRAFALSPVYIE